MLDLKYVRTNLDQVSELLARRGHTFDAAAFQELDARRKSADVSSQSLQAERKSASKKIGQLIGGGMSVDEAKASVAKTLEEIESRLSAAEQAAKEAQTELDALLIAVPNLPDDDVPAGTDEADNVVVDSWGSPREFAFEPKDHVDLGMALGGLDSEMGAKIAGSRFTVMSGSIARLHRALVQFMLDIQTVDFDCTEVNVPYIVNPDSLYGTGNLPKFADELFALKGEQNFYLIPTAEVPVTNIARDRIFDDAELGEDGIRFACHSACFRSEAGSYGRDTRGMIRQHQFEKVELVFLVRPEQSKDAHEALTRQAEEVLRRLELPYQKLLLCGGDMGASARRTYDLEVWLPGQGKYREISSCSNFGDYQARRMKARWKNPATGNNELLHTLNGSALAVGRTLVAVLENYQRDDGSISIPQALQPYMGGVSEITAA